MDSERSREGEKKGKSKRGVVVGIRKKVIFSEATEWRYGLVIKELVIEKDRKVNVIIGYNNGKIREVIEELRETVEEDREMAGGGGGGTRGEP